MSERQSLPVVSCTDPACGACCMEMSSPPGYFLVAFPADGNPPEDLEDFRRFWAMPEALRAELLAHYQSVNSGRAAWEGPCLWLDPQTKRCRHHEHRPGVCREFPAGGVACSQWREKYGLPAGAGTAPKGQITTG